jgi:hypothetical protein
MKILLLAPEPFYQDRGTPIAVSLVLRVLSERGDEVDVVTYHEGRQVHFQHVMLHRIVNLSFIRNIRPGFSLKKVVCDFFLFFKAVWLVRQNHYDFVHAVEESVFIALVLKWIFKVPYVYDMDSSLAQQLVEHYRFLTPLRFVFKWFETLAIRNAKAAAVVCDALAGVIGKRLEKIVVLPDITLLNDVEKAPTFVDEEHPNPDRSR